MDELSCRELQYTEAQSLRDLRRIVLRSDQGTFSIAIEEEKQDPLRNIETMPGTSTAIGRVAAMKSPDPLLTGMPDCGGLCNVIPVKK